MQKDGIWDFGELGTVNGREYKWLITLEGKLPFQYVSRLEFLQKKKVAVHLEKEKAIQDIKERIPIRPKAEQEKEKAEMIKSEKAKGYNPEIYLRNYQTDEQKQKEAIRNTSEYYDEQLRTIEQHLQMPEKKLQQPAIMAGFQNFQGFAKEGETGARILVKENPDYYNKKLPAGAVQLIMVELSYSLRSPVIPKACEEILKALDFAALKNLLGK